MQKVSTVVFGAGVGTDDDPLITSLLRSNSQMNSKVKLLIDYCPKDLKFL